VVELVCVSAFSRSGQIRRLHLLLPFFAPALLLHPSGTLPISHNPCSHARLALLYVT
jgi:hypothetical protein